MKKISHTKTRLIAISRVITLSLFLQLFCSGVATSQGGTWREVGNVFQSFLGDIAAYDQAHLMAFGNAHSSDYQFIARSDDSGKTWEKVLIDTAVLKYSPAGVLISWTTPPFPEYIVYRKSGLVVVSYDSGCIRRSTDYGNTWQLQHFPTARMISSLVFQDDRTGYVLWDSAQSHLFRTDDAGATWNEITLPPFAYRKGVFCLSPTGPDGIFVIAADTVSTWGMRSSDRGKTWQVSSQQIPYIQDVAFTDSMHGVAVYPRRDSSAIYEKAQIMASTDGGMSWKYVVDTLFPGIGGGFWRVRFRDSLNGLAVGPFNRIARTTDGGDHWTFQKSYLLPTGASLRLSFPAGSEGVIGTIDAQVGIFDPTLSVSNEDNSSGGEVDLLPNHLRAGDPLHVRMQGFTEQAEVQVWDVAGRSLLKASSAPHGSSTLRIPTEGLLPSEYFVRITAGKHQWTRKFIIE